MQENNYKIWVVCQDKSWVDKYLFTKWLKDIWFVNYSFKKRENTVLIFVQSKTHFTDDLEEIFDKYNFKYILIPKGSTSINQPLDKSINKPLKDKFQNEYNKYLIENFNNKPTYEHLLYGLIMLIMYGIVNLYLNKLSLILLL